MQIWKFYSGELFQRQCDELFGRRGSFHVSFPSGQFREITMHHKLEANNCTDDNVLLGCQSLYWSTEKTFMGFVLCDNPALLGCDLRIHSRKYAVLNLKILFGMLRIVVQFSVF